MTDLGVVGGESSEAVAVNEAGQVSGIGMVSDQFEPTPRSGTHNPVWPPDISLVRKTVERMTGQCTSPPTDPKPTRGVGHERW
jgi:hypothetical protein